MWSYDIRFLNYDWVDILKWRNLVPFKQKAKILSIIFNFKGDEIPSQVCPDEEEDESDEEEEEEQREEKMSEDESEDEEDSEVLS